MVDSRLLLELPGPNGEIFRIDSYRGGGSFGRVYKASGINSRTIIAVKMPPEDKLSDPTTLAYRTVLNEMSSEMLKVKHPNVVAVLHTDSGTNPDIGPYLMMEYIEGGTLQQEIERRLNASGEFGLEEATALMWGIALGAKAINEHLVHRDIKPDNILLDGATPKIADFGIAKVVSASTRPETFKGIQMWWYKAPESWRQEPNTPKMDVYSVGLVFYQILTLEHPLMKHLSHPFDYDRWREVHLTVQCDDVRAKRSDVSPMLARLMLRMVDKVVGNRPNWDEIINELSPETIPPPSTGLDPRVLASMTAQVDERFREEQTRSASELKRMQEAERETARRMEYVESGKRLLRQFDDILTNYKQQGTGYQFGVTQEESLSRSYALMNERKLVCSVFPYRPTDGAYGFILGAGYLGVSGGLSTNLSLFGSQDNIAAARWSPMRLTLSGAVTDLERWYREAGISRQTIGFLEYEYGQEPWRRDFASYFGISSADTFYEVYNRSRGGGAYNFDVVPIDIVTAFNEILVCGVRIPDRHRSPPLF